MSTPLVNLLLEETSGQVIRIPATPDKTDLSSEETTRITTIIDTMTTEQDHHISRTKTNIGIGEVTITIHNLLLHRDQIHPLRISIDNSDQIHLTPQY